MRNLILIAATGAGSGYVPLAPGTAGSLVGLGLAAGVRRLSGPGDAAIVALALLVLGLGIWSAGRAERILGERDDGRITIDEVAGQLVALVGLPARFDAWLLAFVLFRLADVTKPFPARALERLPGGLGVMADDLMAGLYANLAGQLLWRMLLPEGFI
jgi:phosphatidylglycerophosphatase A